MNERWLRGQLDKWSHRILGGIEKVSSKIIELKNVIEE